MRTVIAASFLLIAGTSISFAQQSQGDAEAGKVRAYTCAGCHGIPDYNNVYPTYRVPRVAGQNQLYLVNALNAYRDGTREHPTMYIQAASMTDEDITNVSAYFSGLGADVDGGSDTGEGAGAEKAAICQSCHGPGGSQSITPDIPTLAGQHEDYLAHAMHAYRNGQREQAVMNTFAQQLSDQDIKDLAEYFADQKSNLRDLKIK